MSKRKRVTRGRSRHPGVVLKRREYKSGRSAWVARYRDPVTGRDHDATLDGPELRLTTQEARTDWAVRLSKRLATQRAALAAGDSLPVRVPIDEAVEDYLTTSSARLRERTIGTYRQGLRRFQAWCERTGAKLTTDLTPPRLVAFREVLQAQPRHTAMKGGKRGSKGTGKTLRSGMSVNRDLASVSVALSAWRRKGLVRLSRDDIADSLRPVPATRRRPSPLKPDEIQELLEAAQRHDATAYKETRAEHTGLGTPGETARYEPVAPLILVSLLSGCRLGELQKLRWVDVDLKAHQGKGELIVTATASKTRTERSVGMDVAPSMARLLAALQLRHGDQPYVFGRSAPLTRDRTLAAQRRLVGQFGAPAFSWQRLRQTCGTYLTNAPGIFGGASAFMSAKRLGHRVAVAENHYLGIVTVPYEARTLEQAMGIEELAEGVVTAVAGGRRAKRATA